MRAATTDRAGKAVERGAPKEYLPFIGWGLFNALVIPGFDVFDRSMWGLVTVGSPLPASWLPSSTSCCEA